MGILLRNRLVIGVVRKVPLLPSLAFPRDIRRSTILLTLVLALGAVAR